MNAKAIIAIKPEFSIYESVVLNSTGDKYFIIGIRGDCGNSGLIEYQLATLEEFGFRPSIWVLKEAINHIVT